MKKILLLASFVFLLAVPAYKASAVVCTNPPTNTVPQGCTPPAGTTDPVGGTTDPVTGTGTTDPSKTTIGNCSYDKQSTQLCNPISGANDLNSLIFKVLKYMLGLIGTVAVVMIVLAGFKMVASQGNESQVKSARNTITWSIIGVVVAFLAYSLVAIVQNAILK